MSRDGGYCPTLPGTPKSHCPSCPLSRGLVGCPGMVATVPPCLVPTVLPVPCPGDWWDILGRWLLSHPARYPQIPLSFLSLVPGTGRMSRDGGYCPTLPGTPKSHCPSCPLSRGLVGCPGMVATVPPCLVPPNPTVLPVPCPGDW